MSLTKLQTTLIDVYERIIMHGQVFDPDQETLNFLLQAGMTPESETNQRYLQLVRTLRHEDYNVRSSAAKFLCMILFKNHNLQCRIRSLLPITILAANLLVFNLPVIYNTSVLTDLQKDMKDDTNPNRNMVFWHFPVHHMQTESLPSLETLEPAVEEMLLLKLDPLYQFVGSLTAGRKLISRQAKMKPGLLERKLTAHFSSPSLNPVKNSIERSKSFRLKPTLVTEKSGIEDASPNQKDPDFFTLGSRSYRSGSKCSSPKSNRSLDKISRKEVRSVTITTDRSMDNSPTRDNNMPVMNHKTPKFSEVKDFWMPKGYPGQGVSNQRRRAQKAVSKKSFNNSKNASQTDTNTTSPVIKEKISLLDILERNPDYVKEVKMRLSKSRMDLQELSETNSPHNRSMNSINRGRARSLTNPRSDRSISKDFSADYMRAEQSDMSRETLRLLKQDRHDMYRDYDKQVERMRLRPFDKKKFESTCFDPNNFPQKIAMPVVDRKKAFVDFLNAGGKVTEKPVSVPGKIEGIKGNTFHGRKWKNHTSKARLSNFAEKEKYVLYLSPTSAKVQADMKMRNPPKEKPELEVIKDHLATDVAGSQQKYITNIMEVEDLDNKVYGESFKKYLDVLNYEKANYNANDPSKLGEAYDLVNIIYDAKEKAVRRHKAPAKTLTTESECEEEEIDDSKPKRKHKDPRFAINVPRSGLFLRRRRSSMASSNAGSDYNSYHHPHSDHHHGNGKGKKSMHSNMHSNEEIVRLPTGNSASLHAEILTLHPLSRGKSFGSSQVKTE